ncbi:hypothetical protein GCM10010342_31880 [Streptomyces anulatus]|nr:hypothetical protein GCM10010342_31880 [Streptomyces anulatus]
MAVRAATAQARARVRAAVRRGMRAPALWGWGGGGGGVGGKRVWGKRKALGPGVGQRGAEHGQAIDMGWA